MLRRGRREAGGRRTPSVTGAVTKFVLSGLAVLVLLAAGGAFLLQELGEREAIRDASQVTRVAGVGIVQPSLTTAVLRGEPAALERFDRLIHKRLLDRNDDMQRVKIWTREGLIVYSDEEELIGERFPLGADEQKILDTGGVHAELSRRADLAGAENRYERGQGDLLEVYLPVRGPGGEELLFETYRRFSSIVAGGQRVWLSFAPALVAALLLLELIQVPLALSLARRVRDTHREREKLLRRAIEASETERRRIAGDLHDGPVQDLAGLAFSLAAAADQSSKSAPEVSGTLTQAAEATRQSMRRLRTALLEIAPVNLERIDLEAALSDAMAPLSDHGINTELEVATERDLAPETKVLLFRAAQETLRNALSHSQANNVSVAVERDNGVVSLSVRDDGRGFSAAERERRESEGHVGLQLLTGMVADAGGELQVTSEPGGGTNVRLEVPIS